MKRLKENKKQATMIILVVVAVFIAVLYQFGVVGGTASQAGPVPAESRWLVNAAIAAVLIIAGYLLAEINKKDKK